MARWLPPNGFTRKDHQLDSRVGGKHRMSFTNFTTGKSRSFGGENLELTPHERIRHTDKFDNPNLPGKMRVTGRPEEGVGRHGAERHARRSAGSHPGRGLPSRLAGIDTLLAKLVEAEIPD
jgi:uncharacterized protein YndB with AHSA1/START domain